MEIRETRLGFVRWNDDERGVSNQFLTRTFENENTVFLVEVVHRAIHRESCTEEATYNSDQQRRERITFAMKVSFGKSNG